MREFISENYNGVMNAKYNPLRYIPNQNTRHAVMLFLMWMWCGIFSLWTGALFFLGASVFVHSLLFFGVLVTLGTFGAARKNDIHIAIPNGHASRVGG